MPRFLRERESSWKLLINENSDEKMKRQGFKGLVLISTIGSSSFFQSRVEMGFDTQICAWIRQLIPRGGEERHDN